MNLKKDDIFPGARVSVDHFKSSTPGRLCTSRGMTASDDMCHGGTIFVDHSSGFVDIRCQVSLGAVDTIKSKMSFEREAHVHGVVVSGCHADNGTFTSKDFVEELIRTQQQMRFSGISAAHQNGIAERGVKTAVNMARTVLLLAALRAPNLVHQDLWPMAMHHAAWSCNCIPRQDTGLSPLEMWSRTSNHALLDLLGNTHAWACPRLCA